MPDVNAGFALTLPPTKAISYFQSKGITPSMGWKALEDEAHAVQFTVAGITKLDVLNDIHQGLSNALANGSTLRQFQDEVEPLLQRKGWLGRGLVADEDGVLQGKQLMPYRLETIFRTNIQSAYAAGRWQQQMRGVAERPYLEYNAVMDNRTRPLHASLNGRVFRWDDPIWQTIYPPNGYNCRCWVRALTKAQLDKHPVGLESSAGRLITVQQPYGTDGEMRPVTAYRDPKTGQLLVPDAGFHLNPGHGYLAGLGQSLLEKSATAAPELAAVAVQETLGNNRLATTMNRDVHEWTQRLTPASSGDFRRVGALSPRVLSRLHTGGVLPSPVITLTADDCLANQEEGTSLWPRLVSAFYRPVAVFLQDNVLNMVTGDNGAYQTVTLNAVKTGFQAARIRAWSPAQASGSLLLDGQFPEVSE
ncbi:minor capsid protein [Enterobacter hormaechei]|uniref:phage head morphogenesis protein n=1 Tax=Enterobacter cloacae complex sp. ESBL7 TaxID=3163325 RepID=UPI002A58C321|nr:minor capsid protein [Enterobacter hormaechei]